MSSTAQYVQKMTKTTGMSFSVAETIGEYGTKLGKELLLRGEYRLSQV
jgi:hypothetical protein